MKLGEGEVRVTDPATGGEKGTKTARFSLIPPEFLWALAEHYGKGARKYADRNWEKGYKWSLSLDALERHLNQWKAGEIFDEETGTHHLVCVAWHACALFCYSLYKKGTNDVHQRPLTDVPVEEPKELGFNVDGYRDAFGKFAPGRHKRLGLNPGEITYD